MVIDAGEGSGKVLTAKNVHALRTLFNVAHKLHPLLGSSWLLVLENLNSLDRILNSPRTTTQVCARPLPMAQDSSAGIGRIWSCMLWMIGYLRCLLGSPCCTICARREVL